MIIFPLICMSLSPNTSLSEPTLPLLSEIYPTEKQFNKFQYGSPIWVAR